MNKHCLSSLLVLALCLVQVLSCQKRIDKVSDGQVESSTSSDAALVNDFIDCKLRTVTHEIVNWEDGKNLKIVGTFVYHADGLPHELVYTNGALTSEPNYYFVYDSKRRLRELRTGHSRTEAGPVIWHRYGYNDKDQIIADTLMNFTGINPTLPTPRFISSLTYDEQGRVKSEYQIEVGASSGTTTNYEYDTRGNLVVAGWPSSSYDNHISIFRTHPLFQFIHRNYSKNNASAQPKYNVKGLPLSSTPLNDNFFNAASTANRGTGVVSATYDCDGYVPPNEFLYCKLRTVTHEMINPPGTPNTQITGTFVYHLDGLPHELVYDRSGTGTPNYYFVYDGKRRLIELQETHRRNEAGPVIYHRYGYNNFNQIVEDTIFNFTSYEPASSYPRFVSTLTYDVHGRVKSELIRELDNGNQRTVTYNYDSRGNLIVAGWPSSSYDDKVSIFRTHTLFQFIHRNYSKNNASVQKRYNSKGLPLSNRPMNDQFFSAYPDNGSTTVITRANYDCP